MAWDFETEPEFQQQLDWMDAFVREEIEPLDVLFPQAAAAYHLDNPVTRRIVEPLKQEVRRRGLWACHLSAALGGQGYGQVKLALMYEVLGRSSWAPNVFGCQAPDSGNAEILAAYGTEEQKRRYLEPLLNGEIVSCYSMTEPQGGSDPKEFRCAARREGREWVIRGEKYFSSHAELAEFLIVMVITDPEVPVHQGASMILVPKGAPGLEIVRRPGLAGEPLGTGYHPHLRFQDVRVPEENLLGGAGQGFAIAQTRLGGGRIMHAMRTVAQVRLALDMMCERALSRRTQGELLARKQAVQLDVADSFVQLEQFRLLVLYAAWQMDRGDRDKTRTYIAAVKAQAGEVLHDVVRRAQHLHGALGMSNEMPLADLWAQVPLQGVMDGPSEVHRITVAKQVLKEYAPAQGPWPSRFLPDRLEDARKKFADALEHEVANR